MTPKATNSKPATETTTRGRPAPPVSGSSTLPAAVSIRSSGAAPGIAASGR